MAINKNALIRYKTIDHCLQNRYRKWTLEDLIDACSDALYEFEGIDGVSKRTVQADIQIMRSNKLGYNAPIVVLERKYYTYEDADYSITNIPLSDQDLTKLGEAVAFLKQFQGFSHFNDLSGMVQKLEDQIYSQKTHSKPVIDFEKNENLKGLEHLDFLYQNIIQKKAIEVTYQSFKARNPASFIFHAYLLKEFNNRWFLIGSKNKGGVIMNLAIDRIQKLKKSTAEFKENEDFNAKTYYENAIGVSVSPGLNVDEVVFFVNHLHAPYIETKPLHKSQKLIEKSYYGVTFSMQVQHNFELEKKLLGFGDGIKILAPERLRKSIYGRLMGAVDLYHTDISEKGLKAHQKRFRHKGYNVLNQIFTKRILNKIDAHIYKHCKENQRNLEQNFAIENLFEVNENIEKMLHTESYLKILNTIDRNLKLESAKYFDIKNKYQSEWFQASNALKVIITFTPFEQDKTGLKLFVGSHHKMLEAEKIKVLEESNLAQSITIEKLNTLILNAQCIHQFYKTDNKTKMRFIELSYSG